MIPIEVYDNVDNLKIDNVNFEYGFKFYVCMQSKKVTNVSVQIVHLFMFSPKQFDPACSNVVRF
jgi:hypothetical protein